MAYFYIADRVLLKTEVNFETIQAEITSCGWGLVWEVIGTLQNGFCGFLWGDLSTTNTFPIFPVLRKSFDVAEFVIF